jgi:hypothetical protein
MPLCCRTYSSSPARSSPGQSACSTDRTCCIHTQSSLTAFQSSVLATSVRSFSTWSESLPFSPESISTRLTYMYELHVFKQILVQRYSRDRSYIGPAGQTWSEPIRYDSIAVHRFHNGPILYHGHKTTLDLCLFLRLVQPVLLPDHHRMAAHRLCIKKLSARVRRQVFY